MPMMNNSCSGVKVDLPANNSSVLVKESKTL